MGELNSILIIGLLLTFGTIASKLFKLIKVPQVVGHILIGVFLGVSGLQLLNTANLPNFSVITTLTLGLVGFTIGGELRWARLKRFGKSIFIITIFESLTATILVGSFVYFITSNIPIALILGSLAAATAPGGTTTILQEYRARGPLTSHLLGVVGADDAFAIIIYAFSLNIAKAFLSASTSIDLKLILHIISYDILMSIVIGFILGFIISLIMLQVKHKDIKLLVILSALFGCTGLSDWLGLSLILSNMSMGVIIGNIRPHRSKTYFDLLQQFSVPTFVLFFILIGAQLDISLLPTLGLLGSAYIILRMIGKYFGVYIGASISSSNQNVKKYLGFCLFSQAGVAIGLAIATQIELSRISVEAGQMGFLVLNLITASTFVFQTIGPIFTRYALVKSNEARELY